MNGLVLIDKPSGCTSHDVVNRWRRLAGTKRVGHLGTLDPMATGLLAVMTGPATRLAQFYERASKTYEAEIRFGLVSDTFDAEGEVTQTGLPAPQLEDVSRALRAFEGRFLQMPPAVSAKKIAGVPAYKLARKKLPVELQPVEVEVAQITIRSAHESYLELEISCSAGTYIRSIAHDLGKNLGCGALLSKLRRTRVGEFTIAQAKTLDELSSLAESGSLQEAVIPAGQLLSNIPAEYVSAPIEAQIRQGRQFRASPFVVPSGAPLVRALSRSGDLVAIGQMIVPNLYHPSVVFQGES